MDVLPRSRRRARSWLRSTRRATRRLRPTRRRVRTARERACDACDVLDGCDGCDGCDPGCDPCLLGLLLVVWCLPHLALLAVTGHPEGRAVGAVRVYQRRVSARRPACCRFTPTCSAYAVEALQVHGLQTGTVLAWRRLRRCRPGGARGHDPVPG